MVEISEQACCVLQVLGDFIDGNYHSSQSQLNTVTARIRELLPNFISPLISIRSSETGGNGVFATKPLRAGEYILLDHPVSSVLDLEAAESEFSGLDGSDSIALIRKMIANYSSELDSTLRNLYPVRDGVIHDSKFTEVEGIPCSILGKLSCILPQDINEASAVKAIQLNSLGFYTFPELLSYSNHLRFLAGTGLYRSASMFNHSCEPNICHFSIGDVAIFCANRDVKENEELFISYIGSDLLVESKSVRDEFLADRDFVCACSKCSLSVNEEDPWVEELDLQTRVSIHLQGDPEKRILLIRNLLDTRTFVSRDRNELLFKLCLELGNSGKSEWDKLLIVIRGNCDMFNVVVYMHYMAYLGSDANLMREALEISRIVLGESFGSRENIRKLLSITDFPNSSPLRDNFDNLWDSYV